MEIHPVVFAELEYSIKEILVVSHVTLVMCQLVVTPGPARVMEAGVVLRLCAEKVANYPTLA